LAVSNDVILPYAVNYFSTTFEAICPRYALSLVEVSNIESSDFSTSPEMFTEVGG